MKVCYWGVLYMYHYYWVPLSHLSRVNRADSLDLTWDKCDLN